MKGRTDTINYKYILAIVLTSMAVALLVHFPELISLFYKNDKHLQLFPEIEPMQVVVEVAFAFFSLLVLFAINTVVFHFNHSTIRITWRQLLWSFLLTLLLSKLLSTAFVELHQHLGFPAVHSVMHYYLHPFRDFIVTCVVTGGCYIIYLVFRQQQVIYENQQLKAENILSQYEVLKNQLNPHMLFNSLNTLQSLIRENPGRAQEYIHELSRVLRYTLQSNEQECVTLHDEIRFVSAYIFLLKMRYEDNLTFEIEVDKAMEGYCLPPMAIQILIENAVKHNEISDRKPLTIRVCTDKEQYVAVTNVLQPKLTMSAGTGIGLANLAERYRLLFHKEIQVTEGESFTVRIPLIRH